MTKKWGMVGRSIWLKTEQWTIPRNLWIQKLEVETLSMAWESWKCLERGERICQKPNLLHLYLSPSEKKTGFWGQIPESSVDLPCSCPAPPSHLCWWMCKPLYRQFGAAWFPQIICFFWMSNFMFAAPFLCTKRNCLVPASAFWWKCLLSPGKSTILWG